MHRAFKKGMHKLSLVPGAPKYPKSMLAVNDDDLREYVTIFYLLITDKKKC